MVKRVPKNSPRMKAAKSRALAAKTAKEPGIAEALDQMDVENELRTRVLKPKQSKRKIAFQR